ncbi:MAG: putative glycoside hydrolase [Armatimonadetes bacterium]|nr:putative glycoside hydrolase [Armatimonadota bacterium]
MQDFDTMGANYFFTRAVRDDAAEKESSIMKSFLCGAAFAGATLLLSGCQSGNGGMTTTASPTTVAASASPVAVATAPTPTPVPSPSPTPPGLQVKLTEPVRGIYISGWVTGGTTRWNELLNLVDKTEINSVVIDVKEDGMMSYATPGIPLAVAVGANQKMIPDIDAKMAQLSKRKIYSIARITCFRDRITAKKRPDLAVQTTGGAPWRDRSGHYWLDPYNKENWDYNVAVAADAAQRGFGEIQWDYVRFPSEGARAGRVYPAKTKGDLRSEARVIAEFLQYAREKLKPYNVVVSADVFGLTVAAKPDYDMGIGQKIDLMMPHLDVVCPMIYPSHYGRGEYGIAHPNASPYKTISFAMRDSVARVKGTNCRVRPWLQDFSLGVRYGEPEVRAQIKATREHGVEEYLLWNASNRYTASALVPLKVKTEPKSAKKAAKPAASPSPDAASSSPAASGTPTPVASPSPTPSV